MRSRPAGRTSGRSTARSTRPTRPGALADPDPPAVRRAEAVRAGHVPVPVRGRAARRAPAGLHRHRLLHPLPADGRPQRAAPDGLRRVRAAGRAVRRADRHPPADDHRGQRRAVPAPAAAAGPGLRRPAAASPPPTPSSTAGPSGSSCRSSTPGTTPSGARPGRSPSWSAQFEAGTRPDPGRAARGRRCPRSSSARSIDDHRLAYISEAPVNWCPGLGTVLANEEVTADGRSERGNFPVFKRSLQQWMMRITAYGDRLLDDLDTLDWPEPVKLMQRNWIGRSRGAHVDFAERRRRRSGCSPPGRTRCSARPTWCWRPSTSWSTR